MTDQADRRQESAATDETAFERAAEEERARRADEAAGLGDPEPADES